MSALIFVIDGGIELQLPKQKASDCICMYTTEICFIARGTSISPNLWKSCEVGGIASNTQNVVLVMNIYFSISELYTRGTNVLTIRKSTMEGVVLSQLL